MPTRRIFEQRITQQVGGCHNHRLTGNRQISVILTQVEVDAADPAFKNPTKPVGPFYPKYDEALAPMVKVGESYRKVVASPVPKRIVELPTIKALVELGNVVICCGGGGIPVTVRDGELHGAPAVIDKDRTSSLLARSLNADALVMLTDVDGLYRNFGKPDQEMVRNLDTSNLDKDWLATLPPGSIGPKVTSGIEFANATGGWAAIGSLDQLKDIISGNSGTRITSAIADVKHKIPLSDDSDDWSAQHVKQWLQKDLRILAEHAQKIADSGCAVKSFTQEKLEGLGIPPRVSAFILDEAKALSVTPYSKRAAVVASPAHWPSNGIISSNNTALLVVDVQKHYFGEGSSAALQTLNTIITKSRGAFPIIFTQAGYEADLSNCNWLQHKQQNGQVLTKGSAGWGLVVEANSEETVISHLPSTFSGSNLFSQLQAKGVTNLIVVGCIDASLRVVEEATERGIDALIVEDASYSPNLEVQRSGIRVAVVGGHCSSTSSNFLLSAY